MVLLKRSMVRNSSFYYFISNVLQIDTFEKYNKNKLLENKIFKRYVKYRPQFFRVESIILNYCQIAELFPNNYHQFLYLAHHGVVTVCTPAVVHRPQFEFSDM